MQKNESGADLDSLVFDFNKLVIHSHFDETIKAIHDLNVKLPAFSTSLDIDYSRLDFPHNGELVTAIKEVSKVTLNSQRGQEAVSKLGNIVAYDEFINRFDSLEGTAYFASHSLVLLAEKDYVPLNYLTFYFYSRSKAIVQKSRHVRESVDVEMDSKTDFVKDKIRFIEKSVPPRSIVLIDGPLIGGDVYTHMIRAIKTFHEKDIIPIFFVKNSSSNLVTDNIPTLKGQYNSDLHWTYDFLKAGERTSFFKYVDKNNPQNAKVFCYLKPFQLSPQRVELHVDTYLKYEHMLPMIMDLVYYLIIVQGDMNNPQVRPIAIAEKYARETLRLINVNEIVHELGIVPTMNQKRFGW